MATDRTTNTYRKTLPAAFLRKAHYVHDQHTHEFRESGVALCEQDGSIITLNGWRMAYADTEPNAEMLKTAMREQGAGMWRITYDISADEHGGFDPIFTIREITRVDDIDTCIPLDARISMDAEDCSQEQLRRALLILMQETCTRIARAEYQANGWLEIDNDQRARHMRHCGYQVAADEVARVIGKFERWATTAADDTRFCSTIPEDEA